MLNVLTMWRLIKHKAKTSLSPLDMCYCCTVCLDLINYLIDSRALLLMELEGCMDGNSKTPSPNHPCEDSNEPQMRLSMQQGCTPIQDLFHFCAVGKSRDASSIIIRLLLHVSAINLIIHLSMYYYAVQLGLWSVC